MAATEKSQFYKTVLKVTVLSVGPYDPQGDLELVAHDIMEADCVGQVDEESSQRLSGEQMARELHALGSEPGFFGLDDAGNSIYD